MGRQDSAGVGDFALGFAPGRVELLGNHTDYNAGVVLGAAIDRGITVRGRPRTDDTIELESSGHARIETSALHLQPFAARSWANYPLGVVSEMRALGIETDGFEAEIFTDLPEGAGLSSSAALEVATAFFLIRLSGTTFAPLDVAKACQRAEHRFAGVQSGLLDQVISIFGQRDHVVFFDCRSEEVQRVPFPAEVAFVISDSGVKRQLVSGDYNRRREETAEAARQLGVATLREATVSSIQARHDLPEVLRRRALHVAGENERVLRAVQLLQARDLLGFGGLLNESHQSSREYFENSTAELDLLVAIAQELPGVLGARLTGAGFGGATITLCQRAAAKEIAREINGRYERKRGLHARAFVCECADGALARLS